MITTLMNIHRTIKHTHTKINNNDNTLDNDDDDELEPIEDNDLDEEQEDNITTPPMADEFVSTSQHNGALLAVCDIEDTTRAVDEEEKRIQEFVGRGYGCYNGSNKCQCSLFFPIEHYRSLRSTFAELSHDELDLIVLGQIMALTFQSSLLQGHHSYSPTERKITYTQLYHQGHRVCQHTFLFIHTIGRKRFKNMKASFLKTGPVPRVHGNTGNRPKHQLSLQQVTDVTQYILNYTGKKQHTCCHILYMHYKSHLTCIYTVHAGADLEMCEWWGCVIFAREARAKF